MNRILIHHLKQHIDASVCIEGWVSTRRDQGKLIFFDIRDRTGTVQTVVLPGSTALESARQVRTESIVRLEGIVHLRPEKNRNPDAQYGDIEVEVTELTILAKPIDVPFELNADLNIDTYLDHLPFTLRSEKARGIFSLQATIIESFREALRKEGFTEFQAPALVGADAEGGAAAFPVEYYYDRKAFLATSPQFYKQIMVGVFERAFTTPHVFRGEKHATTRHLSEYASMDFEMGFIHDHHDVMHMLETCMQHIVAMVTAHHADTFTLCNADLPLLPETIPVVSLSEAQDILAQQYSIDARGEPDLEPEHERLLCQWSKETHRSDFLFVTHYPVSKRPFYTYEDEARPGYTKSFDLLFRGLEITTGGQRVHDYDTLIAKIREKGLNPDLFSFYLQAFKTGMPPHGGCATGLERITARMLNLPNVKEATLFPRDLNRIDIRLSEQESDEA